MTLERKSNDFLKSIKIQRDLNDFLKSLPFSAEERGSLIHKASLHSSKFNVSVEVFYRFAISYFSSKELSNTVSLFQDFLTDYYFYAEYIVGGVL